ncbi:DUF4145 domain-containing protein [Providencia heimbachae]|uniref:DUF4145 domain-containing protein n=2 Tax=Providencia heimbachae TaxID=333962 RepID=UPI00223FD1E3|nr:DUF4145 domain-containing protein [Providencia heimbachae]
MIHQSLSAYFTKGRCPDWACPSCGNRTLVIKKGSFNFAEIPESVERYRQEYGELSDIELVFSCLLECEHTKCRNVIAVGGNGCVDQIPDDQITTEGDNIIDFFQAKFFIPPLKAFIIPTNCPKSVSQPLELSFSLFLNSPNAAANAIRIALEVLMDELGVTMARNLHQRIESLSEEYAEHKDALMAIKWLGNAGSHEIDRIKIRDIEDAYKVIEFVFSKIYEDRTKKVHAIVRRMTESFNPPKI